jgi:superfamily II DNA or RNA helicase
VVFCTTLEHAQQTTDDLCQAGIPAGVVHGGLNALTRSVTLKQFHAGEIKVVCNVHVLTEGWDCPSAEVCILTRRPAHAGTFLQMVGRVLRPAPGKSQALVLDLCGSVHDHGTPDCEREFSLDGKGIKRSDRQPIRQCPTCGSVFVATGDNFCPECGCEMPRKAAELPRSVGAGLTELGDRRPPRPMKPIVLASKFPGRCRTCTGLIAVGDRIAWAQGQKPQHEMCWVNGLMTKVAG